jgi:hypothetical protein
MPSSLITADDLLQVINSQPSQKDLTEQELALETIDQIIDRKIAPLEADDSSMLIDANDIEYLAEDDDMDDNLDDEI